MATLTSSYQYIGRTGAVSCDAGWKYYVLLYAKTSGSIATGKHTVSVKLRLACTSDSTFYGYRTNGSVTVGGISAISWSNAQKPNSTWKGSLTVGGVTYQRYIDLEEGSAVIDTQYAKKEVTIEVSWNRRDVDGTRPSWLPYTTPVTASVKVTLPMIATASVPTLSADLVVMNSTVMITTNRKSTTLTHDLTYSFGGSTGTIATGVGDSYKWKVPDLVAKIPNKMEATCTITCKTRNGSTVIGTKTVELTLVVPAASVPTVEEETVQMGNKVNVYTNRKSTAYTHTLTYKIGDKTGTIKEDVGGGRTWTPPKSLAAYTGNELKATCTITCKTYNGSFLVGTETTKISLTVPDATVPKLSATTVAMGSQVTISMPKEADVYTHDLSYSFAGKTETIDSDVCADTPWTIPLSLAETIPSDTKGTIAITCKTRFKNSNTVVGTNTVSCTVTVPNNSTTKPKVTMTLSPVHELSSKFDGVYVQGKSKVKVNYMASSDYSTIKTYETSLLNKKGSSNPYTSALGNAGTVKITGKVTDARGYSTTKEKSITVIDYSRPRIIPYSGKSNLVCVRSKDGKANPSGEKILIQIGRKFSKVISGGTQKNYCKLTYEWKADSQDDDEYSSPVTLLARTATSDYVSKEISDITFLNKVAYNIRLTATDDVGDKDTVVITVPTAFATWHSPPGGHGFTLGGYHDPAKKDVFDCKFDAEFQGNITGRVLGMGALPRIPENEDANNYTDFGVYAVTSNATAKTIANLPSEKAGTLRVWSANGTGRVYEGNYIYIMQEYICYDNSAFYRRSILLNGADSVWTYKPWKTIWSE